MKLEELSPSDRALIQKVHLMLRKFGAQPAVEADRADVDWAKNSFSRWKKYNLFPFLLATEDLSPLTAPEYGFVIAWFSIRNAKDYYRFATEPLYKHGFLPIGTDPGGNLVLIDTRSSDGLRVVLFYFPGVSEGFREKYAIRTKHSLHSFLDWVWQRPYDFVHCWDGHFQDKSS